MKKKIVIASVLKPIDDVRSYWKLSQSIAKTNKYEVNIIGNATKKEIHSENIIFHPHELMRTNWVKRIIIRANIARKILRIKPELLVITTPELLKVAVLSRILTGCRVIYDVQENYYLNLTKINPSIGKLLYGLVVRLEEEIWRPFIDEYWLAEKCYEDQLNFTKGKSLTVENKAFAHSIQPTKSDKLKLLFSGTISTYSGVENALHFYDELIKSRSDATLSIIGQIHDLGLKQHLESASQKLPGLTLNISLNPIPYSEILVAFSSANLAVIGYTPNPVNKEKLPTKLYEYSRYKLPYLVQKGTRWSKLGEQLGGAIPVDFDNPDIENVLKTLKNSSNLFPNEYQHDATWEYESEKIIASINKLSI